MIGLTGLMPRRKTADPIPEKKPGQLVLPGLWQMGNVENQWHRVEYREKNFKCKYYTTEQEHHKNGIKPTDLGLANRDLKCDFSDTS